VDKYLKQKIDLERKQKLLDERNDRQLSDMQKRNSTPVIKDDSLSTKDVWKVKGGSPSVDTKQVQKLSNMDEVAKKIADFRAAKALGKKALSVLPFAGAGYAALQGDPAMAAEELAGDVPVVGQAYEAFKPEGAGQSAEDEKMMLAEIQARKNYDNSPGGLAAQARKEALKKIGQ
jgi:hypothetical protein